MTSVLPRALLACWHDLGAGPKLLQGEPRYAATPTMSLHNLTNEVLYMYMLNTVLELSLSHK